MLTQKPTDNETKPEDSKKDGVEPDSSNVGLKKINTEREVIVN